MSEPVLIDPETGMPAVPEGYFWRIKNTSLGILWTLELRKRNKRWGSHMVRRESILPPSDFRVTSHDDWEDITRREAAVLWSAEFEDSYGMHYLGDYPPKRLLSDVRETDTEVHPADDRSA